MKKLMAEKRVAMICNPTETKIIEGSTSLDAKVSKKAEAVADCLRTMMTEGGFVLGCQTGLKRFNNLFIDWENGKATEKASTLPTIKDITDACRSLYPECKTMGFMPIVRINNDGATIIICVRWVEDFYAERKEGAVKKTKAKKPLDVEKLLSALSGEEAETLKTLQEGILGLLKEKGAFKVSKKKVA